MRNTPARLRLAPDVHVCIPRLVGIPGVTELVVSIRPEKIHLQKTKPAGGQRLRSGG
ncbi:hypothetical protein CfE428DRAFT_1712 [Chthoniobacter flavus Ellin428]|uniref:Uncharacterized protein n=1 Tax=Chthoniobacter flavus Ellin428 TaxID=497964 RepID=B4CYH4_9BACT|nr:hypothetical protein [Chthoniobacter flavus]EDY20515.1 hypothetical protein CfE428DRAFT_1712 [Chthoniobacter flavus Ellin428]